jgi:hypothetical protein
MKSALKEFSLAIISENMKQIDKVSLELREFGIMPHYYTKLDEFWVDAKNTHIDFVIVDIEKMSERDLLFRNHPKVMEGKLGFSFFYSSESMALLPSTYGLAHEGYLATDFDLHPQLQVILSRFNERSSLYAANETLSTKLNHLDLKTKAWHQDFLRLKDMRTVEEKIDNYLRGLDNCANDSLFFDKLIINSDQTSEIEQFGLYYFAKGKKSLVSPKIHTKKAVVLPELWVMDSHVDSIDHFALEMATQATRSLFSKHKKIIKIKRKNRVHALLILDSQIFNEEKELMILEKKLSTYFSFIVPEEHESARVNIGSIYDVAQFFEEEIKDKKQRFIKLNFSSVLENIGEGKNRFFWKPFFVDLSKELRSMVSGITISNMSLTELVLSFESSTFEQDYQKIKAVIEDIELWKYFEHTSLLMKANLAIEMSILSPGSIESLVSKSASHAHSHHKTMTKSNPYLNDNQL